MKKFYLTAFLVIAVTGVFNNLSSQQLCEQFSSTTFPPTGWTNDNPAYCYRTTYSGFGQGVGSAVFDFWNAASGTIMNLTTPVFQPTITGDSLVVDMAYCFYVGKMDSLIILTSTNSGSAFTSLVRLGGTTLGTTTNCSDPFLPTASQWAKRSYAVPTGTNRIRFQGKGYFGDNLYIDSICIKSVIIGIVPIKEAIPSEFSLSQNYPNPFNPSTNIKFNIPLLREVAESRGVSVQLKIYDVLGKKISTLVNKQLQPGGYEVTWDASNYPSGIYFYKLVVGDNTNNGEGFTATKKMLLVK